MTSSGAHRAPPYPPSGILHAGTPALCADRALFLSFPRCRGTPAKRPPAGRATTGPKPLAARPAGDRGRCTHARPTSALDLRRPTR
ncbi:hypothetical protein BSLA_01f0404 [Burkholderia stabilis]|nr:hypothetical protein BSLA_01f0404 [Burkholderia stabilis]